MTTNEEKSYRAFKLARVIACHNVRIASQIAHNAKKGLKPNAWRPREIKKSYVFREGQGLVSLPDYEALCAYLAFKREAVIWHMVTCLLKGVDDGVHDLKDPYCLQKARNQAPKGEREKLMKKAARRREELQWWVAHNMKTAEAICTPLFAEYEERAKRRALQEAQK